MSMCTFNNNVWPNANQVLTTSESYSTRLGIYRAMFENMLFRAPSYFTFPPLPLELYSFSSHTFTNAGATGRFGPTLSECRSAYSSQPWAQNSNFFDMNTQGIQLWTVPDSGTYRITCAGAQGGNAASTAIGGRGAIMRGDFNLARGQIIAILVGQQGGVRLLECNAGGGGGSFVWNTQSTAEPLIVGGGGGGGGGGAGDTLQPGSPGWIYTAGTGDAIGRTAGTNGMGATPGGAGWKSNGGVGGWMSNHNLQCRRPLEGGSGGSATGYPVLVGDGGFGGGASASDGFCRYFGAGGGGGYSGGAGPETTGALDAVQPGGGGGSYNIGTNQMNLPGANSGHGSVTITRL